MPKSSLDDILEVQRSVDSLDKAGKRAILKILLKQDLSSKGKYTPPPEPSAIKPVTYTEGGE